MITRKIKKLLCKPRLFFTDFFRNRKKHLIVMINIASWKRNIFNHFFDSKSKVLYLPLNKSIKSLNIVAQNFAEIKIIIWGYPNYLFFKELDAFIKANDCQLIRVEDGFVRSFGLGVDHIPPRSICFDNSSIYFNAEEESDLEKIIKNKNNFLNKKILSDAKRYRDLFIKNEITKYNVSTTCKADKLYKNKHNQLRILCVGQCEKDASIAYGSPIVKTNLDLCKIARKENPSAQIIFKQHPDEIDKIEITNLISKYCNIIITESMSINDSLRDVDIVYTISSLFGFEALIRNVKVRTLGIPFYAGYGLTSDYVICKRRNISLNLDEIFALVYLVYPIYINENGEKISYKECFEYFIKQKKQYSNNKLTSCKFVNFHKKRFFSKEDFNKSFNFNTVFTLFTNESIISSNEKTIHNELIKQLCNFCLQNKILLIIKGNSRQAYFGSTINFQNKSKFILKDINEFELFDRFDLAINSTKIFVSKNDPQYFAYLKLNEKIIAIEDLEFLTKDEVYD